MGINGGFNDENVFKYDMPGLPDFSSGVSWKLINKNKVKIIFRAVAE